MPARQSSIALLRSLPDGDSVLSRSICSCNAGLVSHRSRNLSRKTYQCNRSGSRDRSAPSAQAHFAPVRLPLCAVGETRGGCLLEEHVNSSSYRGDLEVARCQ